MPEAGPREPHVQRRGWAKAPLTLILLLVVLIAAFFLVYALVLIL
ncbi:putative membrane protein [Streptomyces hygroscopicus subsp. jinggangensis 5008]|nr:putative membrane protein [Streptomyces hygroscopicus subsp. jinggangensis 5008]AGF61533.1 putative membrane protein [Streptomyces hygroscopicus subsp. jinggangensis TL01]